MADRTTIFLGMARSLAEQTADGNLTILLVDGKWKIFLGLPDCISDQPFDLGKREIDDLQFYETLAEALEDLFAVHDEVRTGSRAGT